MQRAVSRGQATYGVYEADVRRMARSLQPVVDRQYRSPLKQIASKAMILGFLLETTRSQWVLKMDQSWRARLVTVSMSRIGWDIHDEKHGRVLTFKKRRGWKPGRVWGN